jgi:hypothetical protein
VLLGYDDAEGILYLLDEYRSDGRSSVKDDATALLAMLQRNGISPWAVDHWVGDRSHSGDYLSAGKSNRELQRHLCKQLAVDSSAAAERGLFLHTAPKGDGSLRRGMRTANSMLRMGTMRVCRRCVHWDKAARNWAGRKQDPLKDILDASNYGVQRLVDQRILYQRVDEVEDFDAH